nr:hypothetical protein [Tanacetum cinerariifolium]
QASTSGTQTDSAPVYDTDGSAEVHENCDDNEIFNMFTQEEQYTKLLEPIPESHQVPQTDNDVISEDTSVEQGGETVPAQGDDVQEPAAEEVVTEVVPPTSTLPSPPSPVKSSKLRRLKKVGTSQRVESSDDMENVFNQGRIIVDMDQDAGIELVLSMQEDDTEVQEAVEIVTTSKLMTEVVTAAATQAVAASTPIPVVKPKILNITAALVVSTRRRKGVTPKVKDKGKGILIEAPKPIKKKDQIELDVEYARKLQEEIDKEHEETYKNID